jgi:hypothetical protein
VNRIDAAYVSAVRRPLSVVVRRPSSRGHAVPSVIAAYRLRFLLALLAGGLVIAVVVVATVILVGAMAGTAADTSGDFGAVY